MTDQRTTPGIDYKALLADVQEKRRRWDACQRHYFPHQPDGYRVGRKVRCEHCGVDATLPDIGNYVRGYVAAGGTATDVMADWNQR